MDATFYSLALMPLSRRSTFPTRTDSKYDFIFTLKLLWNNYNSDISFSYIVLDFSFDIDQVPNIKIIKCSLSVSLQFSTHHVYPLTCLWAKPVTEDGSGL